MDAIFTYWGSTTGVCATAALWSIPMAGICVSLRPTPGMHSVAAPSILLSKGEPYATQLSSSYSSNIVGIQLGELSRDSPYPSVVPS